MTLDVDAQVMPSAQPQVDSVAFAKVRSRMDSIRQYRPTVALVLAGGGARGLAHLGVRYRISPKNFVSVKGGLFNDDYSFGEFIHIKPVYAFGAEYARQSMFGPLKVAVQWCDLTGVTAYASIGFDL